jgi:hypothetical protein
MGSGMDKDEADILIREAVKSFEAEGKKTFEGIDQDDITVEVGGFRFTDRALGIRRGMVSVSRCVLLVYIFLYPQAC